MLNQEDVLAAVKGGRKSACELLDSRDYSRLIEFFPSDEWKAFGFSPKEGTTHEPEPWTRENILTHLAGDLEFAIQKAEGERGISSELMYYVVKMWMWILDNPLQHHNEYHGYGLPFFMEVKMQYENEFNTQPKRGVTCR